MIKIIVIIILGLSMNAGLSVASELTGSISTDPKKLPGADGSGPSAGPSSINSGMIFPKVKPKAVAAAKPSQPAQSGEIKVLGVQLHPDGVLWRGSLHRVYLVKGGNKRIVRNLAELKLYAGRTITEVTDAELSVYPDRPFLDGELVRERRTAAVYAIEAGKKRKVRDLAELGSKYFGTAIKNASKEEMGFY